MTDASADPAIDALRDAEARFRTAGFTEDEARDGLVAAAVQLLLDGADGQALRELAGADRAGHDELDRLLAATFRGLALEPMDLSDAAHRVAETAALAYLTGASDAEAAAGRVWQAYDALIGEFGEDAPDGAALAYLGITGDGLLDSPPYASEREFYAAACGYLEVRGRMPLPDRLRSVPMPDTPSGPDPRPRPMIERIGMAALALVLAAMFALVAVASFVGGEPFLGVMGALGCLMVLWVGGLTLFKGR